MKIRKRKKRELVVDCFAGGGGASTGIEEALGRPVDIAINHSREAVAMHKENHPRTLHFCQDIRNVDPYQAASGRDVGVLWASPDCTHFSRAKGGKPRSKKIRGLAWIVTKWARAVRPRVIFLENVLEFESWGPLRKDGRPDKRYRGRTFREWVRTLEAIGYVVEWRPMVAADYGTPTSRRRLFVVARCDGKPIVWPEASHDPASYVAASTIIDWEIPVPSIFTRKRPLADRTLERIALGIDRYVVKNARPFIVPLTHHGAPRVHSIDEPLRTVTAANRGEFALAAPILVQTGYGERKGQAPRLLDLSRPLGTVVAGGVKHNLAIAWLTKHYTGVVGSSLSAPLGTITATDHHSLTVAMMRRFTGEDVPPIIVNGERYVIADVGMRMLQPRELFNAQGFPGDYRIDVECDGKPITKTKKVALAGNSVCPQVAKALVDSAIAA